MSATDSPGVSSGQRFGGEEKRLLAGAFENTSIRTGYVSTCWKTTEEQWKELRRKSFDELAGMLWWDAVAATYAKEAKGTAQAFDKSLLIARIIQKRNEERERLDVAQLRVGITPDGAVLYSRNSRTSRDSDGAKKVRLPGGSASERIASEYLYAPKS